MMAGKTIKREVDAPFGFCEHCDIIDVDSVRLYADGKAFQTILKCVNGGICRNAVDLMIRHMPDEELDALRNSAGSGEVSNG